MPLPTKNEVIAFATCLIGLSLLKLFGVLSISWLFITGFIWFPIAFVVSVALFVLLFVTLSGGTITMYKIDTKKENHDTRNYF